MNQLQIEMTNVAWQCIKELLRKINWATTHREIVIAGTMDRDNKIKIPDEPAENSPQHSEWEDQKTKLNLSIDEMEVCKTCLTYCIKQRNLNPTKYGLELVTTFTP